MTEKLIYIFFFLDFDKTAPMLFYCLVSVGKKRKLTKVALTYTAERVRMDATLFFPIEVSNTRENYRNKLKFEIWAFQGKVEYEIP